MTQFSLKSRRRLLESRLDSLQKRVENAKWFLLGLDVQQKPFVLGEESIFYGVRVYPYFHEEVDKLEREIKKDLKRVKDKITEINVHLKRGARPKEKDLGRAFTESRFGTSDRVYFVTSHVFAGQEINGQTLEYINRLCK